MSTDLLIHTITLQLGEAKYRQKTESSIISQYYYFGIATMLEEIIADIRKVNSVTTIERLKSEIDNLSRHQSRGEKNRSFTQGRVEGIKICISIIEKINK